MEMPAPRHGLPLGGRTPDNGSDSHQHNTANRGRLRGVLWRGLWVRLLVSVVVLWAWAVGAPASAQPAVEPGVSPEPTALLCVPGTGVWRTSKDVDGKPTTELAAALCATDKEGLKCPDLVTLRFRDGQPAHAILAQTPPTLRRCELEWQGSLDGLALYHDGEALLGVDPDRLRFVSVNPLPFKTTKDERFTMTDRPGGLVLFSNAERIVMLKTVAGGKALPKAEVLLDLDIKGLLVPPLWQHGRLLLLRPEKLQWWTLDAAGHPTGQPKDMAISPPLGPNDFGLDRFGMMTAYKRAGASVAVAWYPFDGERIAMGLNSTEIIRRVGVEGTPDTTALLTTDGPQADLMSPWGVPTKRPADRFTHRYWRPVDESFSGDGGRPGPMMMGAGPWIAVDGSPPPPVSRSRVLIVNTSTDSWERTAEFDLDTPGRFVAMTTDYLVTFHPQGDKALMVWRLAAKGLIRSVTRADYDAAKLVGLPKFEQIGGSGDLYRLTDDQGHIAIFDASKATITTVLPAPADGTYTRSSPMLGGRTLFEEVQGDPAKASAGDKTASVVRWHHVTERGERKSFGPEAFTSEAFNATTRWFGYCPPQPADAATTSCALTFPTYERAPGDDAHLLALIKTTSPPDRPLETSLALIGGSVLVLLMVMAWRLDLGKRAHQESSSNANPPPELVVVDAEIDGSLRKAVMPTPEDPHAIPLAKERGVLVINREGLRLRLPNQPEIHLPIDADLDLALTRQIDFANHSAGGVLTLTFFSNKDNKRHELAFDVQLPPDVRPFEHIAYRNSMHAPRTTWEAVEPLLELLKRHPNMQQILYRKLTRQARPGEAPTREPSGLIEVTHLVDPKGRRYVTDDDWTTFIRPAAWHNWLIRLVLACGAGAGVGLTLMMVHIGTEDSKTTAVMTLSLAVPVAAALWVILSWGIWNRLHLLRFGRAVQGQWLDEKTLQYSLLDGRTFRLGRSLWENQDLLPVVLSDPRRPRFAVRFNGHRSLGEPQSSAPVGDMKRAWSLNAMRLFPVVAAFGGLFYLGFRTFQAVFPEPLPAARLEFIAAEAAQNNTPMLPPCVQVCQEFKDPARRATCETQCTYRQTRIALSPLAPLDQEVSTDPGEFVETQFKAFDEGLRALNPPQPAPPCDAIAPLIQAIPRWTPRFQETLGKTYGAPRMMSTSPTFAAFNNRITDLAESTVRPLCSPSAACLSNPDKHCAAPPPCTGSVDKLRDALCTLAPALTPITP